MSIWEWIINNEKGAIYQLLPRDNRDSDEEQSEEVEGESTIAPKYITLN
jgi:hypothetical protein